MFDICYIKLFNEEQQPHNSIKNSLIISNELNQLNFGKQNAIFQADSSEDNFMNEMKNDSLSANNVCGTSKKLPGNLHLSDIYTEYGYSPVPVNSLLPYSNQALLSNSRTSSPTQQKQSIFSSGEIIDLKIQGDPTTEEEIRNSIHACLDCSKTFRRLQDLRRHKANIHERIILNTCKHCAKKFTRSDALFRHINKKRCKEMK
ncbi:hypothetical protein HK099_004094 [Clydaea vesicula]|uniref:C2H2-type domain-containing protein n=1 Tax=Clydaea vesicula TaxID=447962 RepID=A0AAD5U2C4_9FUNG|nr:hypothetical protein HK099_004094 [Clydaea vesicula]